jgi:hypothetical protein
MSIDVHGSISDPLMSSHALYLVRGQSLNICTSLDRYLVSFGISSSSTNKYVSTSDSIYSMNLDIYGGSMGLYAS